MSLGTVWFEETGEERVVRSLCKACRWVPIEPLVRLVSPQGVAHEQAPHGDPRTACGKDATGDDWWWRL